MAKTAAVCQSCDADILIANASLAFAQRDDRISNVNHISMKTPFEIITWSTKNDGYTRYQAALIYANRIYLEDKLTSAAVVALPAETRLNALNDVLDKVERRLGAKVSEHVAGLGSA